MSKVPLEPVRMLTIVRYVELVTELLDNLQAKQGRPGLTGTETSMAVFLNESGLTTAAAVIQQHLPNIFENYPVRLGKGSRAYERLSAAMLDKRAVGRIVEPGSALLVDAYWKMDIVKMESKKALDQADEFGLWFRLTMSRR